MNLLRNRVIGGVLRWRWFPLSAQVVMLVAFVLLIGGGWGITTQDTAFAKVLRNTNLANLLVWSYWWPLVVLGAVLFGRVWCTVCPMELITAVCGRVGLRLKAPGFLKSGWVITGFYALIVLVGIHTLAIHRIPHRMALYMTALLGTAALVSLAFEKRAFCSYVCPVGHLLGLYARCAALEWGADDPATCKACKTKDCVASKNRYRLTGRSCTSNLYPATITDNQDCLLCTQCLKACPNDNLRLSVRRPFADFLRSARLKPAQVGFVMLVSGFVVYEILTEWDASGHVLKWVPGHVVGWLGVSGPLAGLISALILFVLFPGVLFFAVSAISRRTAGVPWGAAAGMLALLLLPTMAGAHLLKALLKMTSRIPYWEHVPGDPTGVAAAGSIADGTLALDTSAPQMLFPVLSLLAVGLFGVALGAVVWTFLRSPLFRDQRAAARIPALVGALLYWAVFGVTIVLWRFLA